MICDNKKHNIINQLCVALLVLIGIFYAINCYADNSAVIRRDDTSTYGDARIKLRLVRDDGSRTGFLEYKEEEGSEGVKYLKDGQCSDSIEKYTFCATKSECSKINDYCVDNYIEMSNELLKPNPDRILLNGLENINNYCNNLEIECNKLGGLDASGVETVEDRYGAYSELCISRGFNDQLKVVEAYAPVNGVPGKCIVVNDNGTEMSEEELEDSGCSKGGFNRSGDLKTCYDRDGEAIECNVCKCKVLGGVVAGEELSNGRAARKETLREAGLCIDIPKPKVCDEVNYGRNSNLDNIYWQNDAGKPYSEINKSHVYRTSQFGLNLGHAEFPKVYAGTKGVTGECHGFWKINSDSGKIKASCVENNNGTQFVLNDESSSCVRYECPVVANKTDGGYDDGYAKWPKTTSSDELVEASDNGCMTGFVKVGSLPKRLCEQMGDWQLSEAGYNIPEHASVVVGSYNSMDGNPFKDAIVIYPETSGYCERIACPAITTPGEDGAFWPKTWASRDFNSGRYTKAEGSCDIANGYYPVDAVFIGSIEDGTLQIDMNASIPVKPVRMCDENGSWMPTITNPCATGVCPAIEEDIYSSSGIEKIIWPQVTVGSEVIYEKGVNDEGPHIIEPPSLVNANDFLDEKRKNGVYKIRRKCIENPDGSGIWAETEALCAGGNTTINNAEYDLEDSVVDEESIAGTCESEYGIFINSSVDCGGAKECFNIAENNAPKMVCKSAKEISGKPAIDRVYWTKLDKGASDCELVRCDPSSGIESNSSFKTPDERPIVPGYVWYASNCVPGYSNYYVSGDSDRIDTMPYKTCQENGTWTNVVDECKKLRKCSSYTAIKKVDPDSIGCGIFTLRWLEPQSCDSGYMIEFAAVEKGASDCHVWNYASICYDGKWSKYSDPDGDPNEGGATCNVVKYFNWDARRWNSGTSDLGGSGVYWKEYPGYPVIVTRDGC